MLTQKQKIIEKAIEILRNNPEGIRYSELVRKIQEELPKIKKNVIQWTIYNLDSQRPETVEKPERGLFRFIQYRKVEIFDSGNGIDKVSVLKKGKDNKILEENFYQGFADYLKNNLEECTEAIPLGGNKFGDKWGTPDVFGIYKFSETDPIKPPIEIVSAEIKADSGQLINAFGQACSYKLFSHKVFLVIPKDTERDISRIESLCLRFGIGLILFNKNNPENPNFEIRTRATRNEPDYFYTNRYLKQLDEKDKKLLNI